MKLIHNQMEYQILLKESFINTIVIESPVLMRNFVDQLYNQINGHYGNFVLSKDSTELNISKNIELILNPFIEISHAKKFANKLAVSLKELMVSENFYQKTAEIQSELLKFASLIAHEYSDTIIFSDEIDLTGIIKLLNFSFDFEDSFLENLITYLKAVNKYFQINIFVFIEAISK